MAQRISQPSFAGSFGSGIGQGLAEQIPKEIDRHRLASGLKQFENESQNLNPLQQATRLFSIPGITPQMVQVLPELLKQQNIRSSYQNLANQSSPQQQAFSGQQRPSFNLNEAQFGANPNQKGYRPLTPQSNPLVSPTEIGQPQINANNPTRKESLPQRPLDQQEFLSLVGKYASQFPMESPDQWEKRALQDEQRRISGSEYNQQYDNYLKKVKNDVESEYNKELEKHLQKSGPDTFSDIPGDLQSDMLRTIDRNIKANPNLSVNDAVKNGVNQLLQFSKAKNNLNDLATKPFTNFATPEKRSSNLSRLNTYSKIYDELNRNDEYYNKLKSHTSPSQKDENGNIVRPNNIGFGLSPQNSANIAYPVKNVEGLKEYIDTIKPEDINVRKSRVKENQGPFETLSKKSIGYAINAEKFLSKDPKASSLSIAREIRKKDPNFDQRAYFDQLRRDHQDGILKLEPHQVNELAEGESDYTSTWGDLWWLPIF